MDWNEHFNGSAGSLNIYIYKQGDFANVSESYMHFIMKKINCHQTQFKKHERQEGDIKMENLISNFK